MNFQSVEAGQGNKVNMFGTFVEIGGVQYTPQQKAKAICKIADDTGVSHNVHIYQGTGQLPQPVNLQQRHSFSLSVFQGTSQRGAYTGYSGFWQDKVQVNQQSTPPQPPQAPSQLAEPPKCDDMVRIRSDALGYAKDLVVADKIPHANLENVAVEFTAFIQTGKWSFGQAKWPKQSGIDGPQDIDGPPATDSDVPF